MTNITYKYGGLHEIFTMVWNKLSFELTELSLVVVGAFEIKNLTLAMESDHVKTSESPLTFFMSTLTGSSAQCNITYGDGDQSTYTTTLKDFYDTVENDADIDTAIKTDPGLQNNFIKFSPYLYPGFYDVRVVCENAVSSAHYCTTIQVHDAIVDFNVFPIDPHEFGEPINMVWTLANGTNVTVDVWYNDILCISTTNASLTNNQNNSYDCLVTNSTHYDPDNEVEIKLTARNIVSNATVTVLVEVLQPLLVTNFVAMTTKSQWGSGMPGAGPNQDKFPLEHPVWFKANYTGGPATSHYWKYIYPTSTWHYTCKNCGSLVDYNVQSQIDFGTDVDTLTMKLAVYNVAGYAAKSIFIDMDKSFSLTSVIIDDPVIVNSETTLTINLEDIGDHTCVSVDFGDESSLRLYGDADACDDQYNHTLRTDTVFNVTGPNTTIIEIPHVFVALGKYQVKVKGKNYVSWDDFEQEVVVTLLPCEYPNVTIEGKYEYTLLASLMDLSKL